jgi:hypothetical protein
LGCAANDTPNKGVTKLIRLIEGFIFSVPAMYLIYLGFEYDNNPTSWYLWIVACVVGMPTNIAYFFIFGITFIVCGETAAYLFDYKHLLRMNGFEVLMNIAILAGVVGAHLNGMLVFKILRVLDNRRFSKSL